MATHQFFPSSSRSLAAGSSLRATRGGASLDRDSRRGRLGPLDRWLGRMLQRTLAPVDVALRLWNGWAPCERPRAPVGELIVGDRRSLIGLIVNPDLWFGEAYTAGRIEVDGKLVTVLEALSRVRSKDRVTLGDRLRLWTQARNTQRRSRHNVHHHYDLGNDFFQLWLDREMLYTCAYFPDPGLTLEAAQLAKMDLVCRKLCLAPNEEVVEAGCGWGALALHMARRYGAKVKAFNLSTEQIRYARERAAREGLAGRVEFIEDDYRNISGRFDVFVSVGMLEHVGRPQYSALASVIRRSVRPDSGRGLLHFIGRDRPRPLNAWIRRRVFPGGYPPTVAEVACDVLEPAGASLLDVENLRLHYARTLMHWRERFEAAEAEVRSRFDSTFVRLWRLYLTGSEAAFTTGWMQLFQIVFAPIGGGFVRWTRDDLAGIGR